MSNHSFCLLLIAFLHTLKAPEPGDLDIVEEEVLISASYFRNTVTRNVPESVKAVFQAWAEEKTPEITRPARRWLNRRCLLTDDERLAIPVLGRWMREEWL